MPTLYGPGSIRDYETLDEYRARLNREYSHGGFSGTAGEMPNALTNFYSAVQERFTPEFYAGRFNELRDTMRDLPNQLSSFPPPGQLRDVPLSESIAAAMRAMRDPKAAMINDVIMTFNPSPIAGILAGVNAKTADVARLGIAEQMEKAGASTDDIWRATGWGRVEGGKWAFDIPDNLAQRVNPVLENKPAGWTPKTVGDYMRHDELFKAYPELRNIKMGDAEGLYEIDPFQSVMGGYNPGTKTLSLLPGGDENMPIVLHELQHPIQDIEGWPRGGNTEIAKRYLAQENGKAVSRAFQAKDLAAAKVPEINQAWDEIASLDMALAAKHGVKRFDAELNLRPESYWQKELRAKLTPTEKAARSAAMAKYVQTVETNGGFDSPAFRQWSDAVDAMRAATEGPRETPLSAYNRLAGEVQARATMARMNLTPEQRAARPFWQDYDVPAEQQIVRYGQNASAAIDPKLGDLAKRHFGTTLDPREAGYMLPDGTMLDLSGRHYATGYKNVAGKFVPTRDDYLRAARAVDHRELPEGISDILGGGGGSETMRKFMNQSGALRLAPGIGFDTSTMPTDAQLNSIVAQYTRGRFAGTSLAVDVSNQAGETVASKEFFEPTVASVKAFIRKSLIAD